LRNGRFYEIALKFPIKINIETVKGIFNIEKRVLNIIA
jgi:hypothetical protein